MAFAHLPPLILASGSPRRATLLRQLGISFQTWVPEVPVPEVVSDQLTPFESCQINAYRKARIAAKKFPDALVLAADTVVSIERLVLGKPRDLARAAEMLQKLQGKTHQVVTGVCLLHLREHRQKLFAAATCVTFHALTLGQIQAYHSAVDPLDKAGGYAIQEKGEQLVERVHGSFSNVIGLPLEEVQSQLEIWGHKERGKGLGIRDPANRWL